MADKNPAGHHQSGGDRRMVGGWVAGGRGGVASTCSSKPAMTAPPLAPTTTYSVGQCGACVYVSVTFCAANSGQFQRFDGGNV